MSHTATVKSVPIKDVRALRQMVEDLQRQGIKCELLEKAVPRMYYQDQIKRHLGNNKDFVLNSTNAEVCDYVLNVKDAYYDIGFLKDKDGNYVPLFDDFDYPPYHTPADKKGTRSLKQILGCEFKGGKAQYWSGAVDANEQTLCSIGKMLQSYSVNAATNAALDAGYNVIGTSTDELGQVLIEVEVN